MITEVAKAMLGEHKPHFFDVCRPDANEECTEGVFIEDYTCTNKDYSSWLISDASKSFPSGHSSISVFASLFTAVSMLFLNLTMTIPISSHIQGKYFEIPNKKLIEKTLELKLLQ